MSPCCKSVAWKFVAVLGDFLIRGNYAPLNLTQSYLIFTNPPWKEEFRRILRKLRLPPPPPLLFPLSSCKFPSSMSHTSDIPRKFTPESIVAAYKTPVVPGDCWKIGKEFEDGFL